MPWGQVTRLINSLKPVLCAEHSRLIALLRRSDAELAPLPDPLWSDFGRHKLLGREEAYSDWLAWILAQLETPRLVLPIFGIPSELSVEGKFSIERELPIREGRLDLLVTYGQSLAMCVEVKREEGGPGTTDEQLAGYQQFLDRQSATHRYGVILATTMTGVTEGWRGSSFRPRLWSEVCVKLRRTAAELVNRGRNSTAEDVYAAPGSQMLLAGMIPGICRNSRAEASWFSQSSTRPTTLA
jgi:hypothetical protein